MTIKYKEQSLSTEKRVNDLLSRMTPEEKAAQLTSSRLGHLISDTRCTFAPGKARKKTPHGCAYINRVGGATDLKPQEIAETTNRIQKFFLEETRLGIPVIFLTEATSGVLSRGHTHFPQNIGAGAMFNEKLIKKMGDAVRKEMTATGERMALAPVVDVIRDHRYGRFEESFGEDPYLVAQAGKAYTEGLQAGDLKNGIAATLKHFVAQGISEGGRNCAPVHITEREILDTYGIPFAATIREAGVSAVMAAYHALDGVPCHASKKIITEILKEKFGFSGLIVSDGNGIQLLKTFQEYCESEEEAVKLALNAGIECELDNMYEKHLVNLLQQGEIEEKIINSAVKKVLSLKFELGLFDDPYVKPEQAVETVSCPVHLDLSRKMARQTMTLLKNNGILPLDKNCGDIALIGPLANNKKFAYGDYSYPTHIEEMYQLSEDLTEEEVLARTLFFKREETKFSDLFHDTPTIYEKMQEYISPQTEIHYAPGLKDTHNYNDNSDFYQISEAVKTAEKAGIIIAVCGDTSGIGWENDSGEAVDRAEITLSRPQRKLLRKLKKLGKPIILILCNGRPLELSYEAENMDAILETWKPGQQGAEAICDVLFGDYNPAGRLPVTLPRHQGQLPVYYSRLASGKKQFWHDTYLEVGLDPLYEFGFGLSYTTFAYSNIKMEKNDRGIRVKANIKNTGEKMGEEVIQVYVRKKFTSVLQPERELKAYRRISLAPGEKKTVEFTILYSSLAYHTEDDGPLLEDCSLDVMVGSSSEKIHKKQEFQLKFKNSQRKFSERTFTNPCRVYK